MCNRRGADKQPQRSLILLVIGAIAVLVVVAIMFIPNWDFLQKNRRYDYCSIALCGKMKKHIACKNDGKFGKCCSLTVEVVPMTDELQTIIVDKHNKIRDGVAEGKDEGLESPNRMIEMKWNPEFAQLAEYTAKVCANENDECRNTKKFRHVRQKISTFSTDSTQPTADKVVIGMDQWISEDMELVGPSCSQVGCAAVNQEEDVPNVFFVCNYSSENEPNEEYKLWSSTTMQNDEYCSKTLCGEMKKHIACKNDGKFGKNCSLSVEVVPMTDEFQTFFLDRHNKIRKGVEMKWNPEFAQLAEYTAKTCSKENDECRNTNKFRHVRQKISTFSADSTQPTADKYVFELLMDQWISEDVKLVAPSCSQVGCAAVNQKEETVNVFFVCNYSSENESNEECKL